MPRTKQAARETLCPDVGDRNRFFYRIVVEGLLERVSQSDNVSNIVLVLKAGTSPCVIDPLLSDDSAKGCAEVAQKIRRFLGSAFVP